jgi:hypothetical protein
MTEALVASGQSLSSVAKAVGLKGAVLEQMYAKAAQGDDKRRLNAEDHGKIEEMMRKSKDNQTARQQELLNHFGEILVRPQDAVEWFQQKIAEPE